MNESQHVAPPPYPMKTMGGTSTATYAWGNQANMSGGPVQYQPSLPGAPQFGYAPQPGPPDAPQLGYAPQPGPPGAPQLGYAHQPGPPGAHNYNMFVAGSQTQQQTAPIVVHQQAAPKPPTYMTLAIMVCVLFQNYIFGTVAIIMSTLASSAYDRGDVEGGRTKAKVSLGFSIAGIIFEVLLLIIVLSVVLTASTKSYSSSYYKYSYYG